MIKSILKEGFIVVILMAAIVLLLGILFYDYNPTSKSIPKTVEPYKLSEEVQNEIGHDFESDSENIIKTYKIDASDLNSYEQIDEYNSGKINPFDGYSSEPEQGSSNNTNSSNNNSDYEKPSNTMFNVVGK